jgi:thiol-disulfide isomerase/thioredoxin
MVRSRRFAAWLPTAALSLWVAVPGVWGQSGTQPPPGVGYGQGDTPPEWTLTDQNEHPVKVTDFRGQSVIMVFSAAWCGPCMDAVPVAEALVKRLNSNGEPTALVEILVQNEFGDPSETIDAKDWADQFGIDGPVLSCDGLYTSPAWTQFIEYGRAVGASAFPTVALLTPHGRFIVGGTGFDATSIETILLEHRYGEPRSGIDWLLTTVERSKLSEALAKSLAAPLLTALQGLDQKKPGVACIQLALFYNLVLAQRNKALTDTQVANLGDMAAELYYVTDCP